MNEKSKQLIAQSKELTDKLAAKEKELSEVTASLKAKELEAANSGKSLGEQTKQLQASIADLTKKVADRERELATKTQELKDQTAQHARELKDKEKELEKTSKELKDSQKECEKLQKEVRSMQADISKLKAKGGNEDSGKTKILTQQLNQSNERNIALQKEIDGLNTQLTQLQVAQTQLENNIDSKQELITSLQAREASSEQRVNDLCRQLEVNAREFSAAIEEIDRKYRTQVEETEKRDVSEKLAWNAERAALIEKLDELTTQVNRVNGTLIEYEGKIELLQQKDRESQRILDDALTEVSAMQQNVEDVRSEQQIEAKKRNVMLTELRAALHRETMKAKQAEMRVLELEDETRVLQRRNQQLIIDGANDQSNNPASSPRSMNGPSTPMNAVDEEVSAHLASKLAAVQDENYQLKRKITSLDEHIQLLNDDVNQKKSMIRDFVRRVEVGALPDVPHHHDEEKDNKKKKGKSEDERIALFDKMEYQLQETIIANQKLKEQLKMMSEQFQTAQAQRQQ